MTEMNRSNGGRGSSYFHMDGHMQEGSEQRSGSVFFHSDSQAELTIARYARKDDQAPRPGVQDFRRSPTQQADIKTKINPATGKAHPYNPHTDFISKFEVGFRGCFRCGGDYHGRNGVCPKANDPASTREFWQEMWAHKPSTFNPDRMRNPRGANNTAGGRASHYGPQYQNVSNIIVATTT